jgi:hypothetical protein
MKKSIWVIYLMLIVQILSAQYNVIGIGTNGFGFVPRLSYERSFNKNISCLVGIEGGKYSSTSEGSIASNPVEIQNLKGWGIMPEIRLYPITNKIEAPLGFFIGIHYRQRWLTEHYFKQPNDFKTKAKAYNYGLNLGYTFHSDELTIEALIGFGKAGGAWNIPNSRNLIPSDELNEDLSDVANQLRLELKIGIILPEILD